MNSNRLCRYSGPQERGSALLISLIILLVISLLAIGGMQGTILQERMSANMHDRELAFQAAETALRDAELLLMSDPPDNITNSNGIYDLNNAGTPNWTGSPVSAGNGSLNYPQNASGAALDGVAAQPQYFIERIGLTPAGTETEAGVPVPPVSFYRITARGFGATAQSVVVLRSVFRNQ